MPHGARDAPHLLADRLDVALPRIVVSETPAQMAGAAGDHVQRGADLVRDDAGHLADSREALGVADLPLEPGAALLGAAALRLRLVELAGHAVERPGEVTDLRVAGGGDPRLQVSARDL